MKLLKCLCGLVSGIRRWLHEVPFTSLAIQMFFFCFLINFPGFVKCPVDDTNNMIIIVLLPDILEILPWRYFFNNQNKLIVVIYIILVLNEDNFNLSPFKSSSEVETSRLINKSIVDVISFYYASKSTENNITH